MRIVIIGAVAAGTSAAAKARRNDADADIVLYEKDAFISYSGCGMPYYLGGALESADVLTPRDPAYFKRTYRASVLTRHEVVALSPKAKRVTVKNLATGAVFYDHYDKLLIATGASAVVPPIEGADQAHVFVLRTMGDMNQIERFINARRPRSALIIGSGFVGLEMCEALKNRGMDVTLVERLPQVMPRLDADMATLVEAHLKANGVSVLTGATAACIAKSAVHLADGQAVPADMVLLATGVRPNVALASAAGVALGAGGAIQVDARMRTNIADIYACGDCTEHMHRVTGRPVYRPLGSTANKTGRIAGDSMTGGHMAFSGILGTGILKIFDLTVAQTGLSEAEALEHGYPVALCRHQNLDRPAYMHGREMTIKAVADQTDGRLLGAQIVGFQGVDKRMDVFVTAITFGAKAHDLSHLDLAYAPPFSTTRDPALYTGMILEGVLRKGDKGPGTRAD